MSMKVPKCRFVMSEIVMEDLPCLRYEKSFLNVCQAELDRV